MSKTGKRKDRRLLLLYQYFHPDDVVSAHHYTHLAEDLQSRGWQVIAMPVNKARHDESRVFPRHEDYKGIEIQRIRCPSFLKQNSTIGRGLRALWVICAWALAAFRKKSLPDIDLLVIGTDPILSLIAAAVWRVVRPGTKLAHWCFDLFPETGVAAGILGGKSLLTRLFKLLARGSYAACDLIVDTAPCQRRRLETYGNHVARATCTPWALVEPPAPLRVDPIVRRSLFGQARLALFYSGNLGMAYSYELFVELIRLLRSSDAQLVFGVRGKRVEELKSSLCEQDTNISFCSFGSVDELSERLSAADIHLVSLQPEWTGTLVPSKFFGSLAIGRPVIFAGSEDSAVAHWTRMYKLGWVLTKENLNRVAEEVAEISITPGRMDELNRRCHQVYQDVFSRTHVIDIWDHELRKVMAGYEVHEPARKRLAVGEVLR